MGMAMHVAGLRIDPPQENPVPAWPSLGCRLKHRAEGEFVRQPTQKALGCSQTRKQYLGVRKT